MVFACKLCIATKGLTGADLAKLPQSEAEFFEHLRTVHGLHVYTREEAKALNFTVHVPGVGDGS